MVQLPAVPAGSGSFKVTVEASPGPALLTWMLNSTSSPALTVPASGVFSTVRSGFWQVTWPSSESFGALVAEAVAVLS